MIDVRNISKTYHVTKKEEGIRGALCIFRLNGTASPR